MKMREKNPVLKDLINELNKKGVETPFWKMVAKGLNRPTRKKHEVNLYELEKNVKAKETVVVPGTVLGTGEITKPINVAALKFSGQAQKLIENAGGKCMSIHDAISLKPKNMRIIG